MKKVKAVILIISVLFSLSCSRERIYKENKLQLGTVVNITIIGKDNDRVSTAFDAAFKEIGRIEWLMSPVKKQSDIYKINNYSWKKPIVVSEETYDLIEKSNGISDETIGAFDATFLTVGRLWKFRRKSFIPPTLRSIKRKLKSLGYKNIILNEKYNSVKLKRRGTKLGLGGIAKGYAIKRAIEKLREHKIKGAIVEAGGDLQVIGDKYGNQWVAGLVHPRSKDILLSVNLRDGETITTSGDYERFATYKGKRYHHILNPANGLPARNFSSVSVICKDPVEADAYSTAFFVMGKEKTIEFLTTRKDLSVILIDKEMNIYASSRLRKKVNLFAKDNEIVWF